MMKETIEERISRYLTGEAGIEEREAFEKEMGSDPKLNEQFIAYKKIWLASLAETPSVWNVDKGWARFSGELNEGLPEIRHTRNRKFGWTVAAALVLAFGVAVYLWLQPRTIDYAHNQAGDPVVLADGSKIHLNKGASVKVHSFKGKKRKVELQGEAFFDINHDKKRPFLVMAGGTLTEVVGTSFNVDQANGQTTIFVKRGKVIFRSETNDEVAVALTSGEAAVYREDDIRRIINPSPNLHSWHSRELSFVKNMPFGDIIADISTYFNKEISFENASLKKCRVTIPLSFKEPEFRSVMEAVVGPVSADIVIENDKCIIKGGVTCY